MFITVTDTTLLTPSGGVASNVPIKIICTQGFDQVLTGSVSEFTTGSDGSYDFPLYYGTHAIYVRFDVKLILLGKVTITNELADTATISDLLLYTEPMLPSEIALVSSLVEEAREYSEIAETAKDEAVSIKESLEPLDSVAEIPNITGYTVGDKITWNGYYSGLDGGGNWGIIKEGVHVADGGSIFTISGDFYVEADLKSDDLNIAKFGGIDGSDVTEAIKAAIVYADDNLKSVVGYGVYYTTSEEITVPAGISVNFPNAVFTNGTGVKDFSAFTFNGSGKNSYINYIFAYGGGITLKSNTADIGFKTIFKCNEGIIIFADGASNLDNKVTGMSIGTCDDAIVFRQNEQGLVQQGNEIRINFVNTCKNTLTFDDGGVHTSQSNWDSNLVELQASDPYQLDDITLFNNLSAYPIPNLVYHIKSWVGGWASIDKLIKGSVSACDFKFSMAKTIEMGEVDSVVTSGVALDSCFFSTARLSNIGTGSSRECTGSTDSSLFGNPLQRVANRCQMTLTSNLEVGANTTCYMWHILCQSNYSDRFLITPLTSDVSIAYIPQGATDTGRVRVLIRNLDDSIILSGTSIEFMVTQLY